jgi:ferredoxin
VTATGALTEVGDEAVVLLCSDAAALLAEGPGSLLGLTQDLRQEFSGVRLAVLPELCGRMSGLAGALRPFKPQRVVVGCAQARDRRQLVLGSLRDAGVHPSAGQVVDLAPAKAASHSAVAQQGAASLRAALARVYAADLERPAQTVTRGARVGSARIGRRELFGFAASGRHPVLRWTSELCVGHGPARPCALSCPQGALSLGDRSLVVDAGLCTGCGACLRACSSGALALEDCSLQQVEAAARVLAADARRLGLGVSITCESRANSGQMPWLGGGWLSLEVPSLEMVSAGWPLQFLAAGAPVKLAACGDSACRSRGEHIARFVDGLTGGFQAPPRTLISASEIVLSEPEATVRALVALQKGGVAPQPPWRSESGVAPMGEIAIDGAHCSGCGSCALACHTGALAIETAKEGDGAFPDEETRLTFAASRCSACGACSASCPEQALSLRRVVSSPALGGERSTLLHFGKKARCTSCGAPLAVAVLPQALLDRLTSSRPGMARWLEASGRCGRCALPDRAP